MDLSGGSVSFPRRLSNASRTGPVERNGWLRTEGGSLLNEHGDVAQLRGVSLFWSQWGGRFFSCEWIDRLVREWNIDVLRIPLGVDHQGYLTHPSRELKKVEHVVEACVAAGIYAVVDWHSHDPFTADAKWFCFNHCNVCWVSWEEIKRTYGNQSFGWTVKAYLVP